MSNSNSTSDEQWRPIIGYENIYIISSLGRVQRTVCSKGYPAGMILKPTKTKNGYLIVRLWSNGAKKALYVHRLVVAAFVGECPPKHEVNHKNSLRDDNRLENLEYVTRSGNNLHAYREGKRNAVVPQGERHRNWKITDEQVLEIVKLHYEGLSYAKIAKLFNVHWTSIRSIVTGETHTYVIRTY